MTTTVSSSDAAGPGAVRRGLVWDWPTRVVHWLLALGFAGSWLTAELGFEWTEVHFYLGYTTLGLVSFRLVWGFIGPRHARFAHFVRSPATVLRYLRGEHPAGVGHNPLGALAVIALLLCMGLQAGTGLFISDDIFYAGPYNGAVSGATAGWLAGIHDTNFHVLQALVALHLCAIAFYTLRGHGLITPMITGSSRFTAGAAGSEHQWIDAAARAGSRGHWLPRAFMRFLHWRRRRRSWISADASSATRCCRRSVLT